MEFQTLGPKMKYVSFLDEIRLIFKDEIRLIFQMKYVSFLKVLLVDHSKMLVFISPSHYQNFFQR